MNFFAAVILGIVEGITEFLPISSTAHLILTGSLLGIENQSFTKSFEIIIQLGAIAAIAVLFARQFLTSKEKFLTAVIGFVPTGLVGVLVYPFLKQYLLGNTTIVALALLFGGIVILLVEKRVAKGGTLSDAWITNKNALLIGLAQSIAIIPGVSRSGATIVAALLLGYSRTVAIEFTFLLAIPTMLAATGLELVKNYNSFDSVQAVLLATGFAVAFTTAYVVVRWFAAFVSRHTFKLFAWYRIVLAVGMLMILGFSG